MNFNINLNQNRNGNSKGGGIVMGLLLIVLGSALLWWNEGNNVRNIKAVAQLEKEMIEMKSDKVSSEYDGRAVATNGNLIVDDEPVSDDEFEVVIKTPKLKRVVEMYQWDEDEDTDEDGYTTYSYSKKWSETILTKKNHSDKSHENPSSMPYKSKEFYANDVKVGAYNLSDDQIKGLATDAYYDVPGEILEDMVGFSKQDVYITNSYNIENPIIGDIRISWKLNNWKEASVLAVVTGNTFKDFISDSEVHINRVEEGILTGNQLMNHQKDENNMMKWILRGVGALIIFLGYLALTGPLSRLASKVPILGSVVGGALTLISFLLGLINTLLIIIIAWFRFRPVLSIVLLIIIAVAVVLIIRISKKNKQEQAQ